MSSLAKQLKQLQIPQNLVGPATKKQSHKASLLFDSKEAADIDNEAIFSLASNGLEELTVIEPAFGAFRDTLFSELSKKMERSLQTKEYNDRLNKQISEFLRYLSPYFLLKPAHKALEWLIRRYRIHISNEDELMSCILPYHETNLFVRVVQLLKVRNPASNYHWLEPLQKSGSPLAKTTLLNKCTTDMAFLNRICELVPKTLELDCPVSSLRVVFTFYASTVVGTLEMMERITEEIITLLLPYIVKGLKSSVSEYLSASYMIIAQLCNKCTLEENLVKSLLEIICKHLKVELAMEGLMCLTITCSSQSKQRIPKKAFKNLMSLENLTNHVCQLASKCDITALLQVLLPQLVSAMIKECLQSEDSPKDSHLAQSLYTLAKELDMDKPLVKLFTRSVLVEYCKARNEVSDDASGVKKLNKCVKLLAQYLEKRYPTELESSLEEYLDGLKSSLEEESEETVYQYSQWTLEFMSLALSGCKSQVLPDSSASLMLSLHHPKSDVRQLAVKHLHNVIKDDKVSQGDDEFISGALLARLSDDDLSVVDSVLDMDKVLIKFLPTEQLVEKLLGILQAGEWNEQCDKAVLLLSSPELVNDNPVLLDKVVYGLLPLLFLNQKTHKQAVALAKRLSQTVLTDVHYLLKHIKNFIKKKEWKACDSSSDPDVHVLAAGNRALFAWLGENMASLPGNQLLDKVKALSKYSSDPSSSSFFTLIVNCILGKVVAKATVAKQLDMLDLVLQLLLISLEGADKLKGSTTSAKEKESESRPGYVDGVVPTDLISVLISYMAKNKTKRTEIAKASIHLWLLGNFIRSMTSMNASKGTWWNSKRSTDSTKYTKMLLLLFNVLVKGACCEKPTAHQPTFRQLLQELIQCHLSSKADLIKFLGLIWSSPVSKKHVLDTDVVQCPVLLQIHSLHVGNACLASLKKQDFKNITEPSSAAVASLLVPLCNPVSAIRKGALLCLKSLQSSFTFPPPVGTFVDLLVESEEELGADHDHLQRMFTLAFSCLSSPTEKPTGKGKSKRSEEEKVLAGMLDYVVGQTVSDETPTHVQKILLTIMAGVVTQPMLKSCLPTLEKLVAKSTATGLTPDENACLNLLIQKFSPVTAVMLESEPRLWDVMKRIFDLRVSVCPGHPPPVIMLLTQINNTFFQAIPLKTTQQEILTILLDILQHTKNDRIIHKVKDTISQVMLSAELVLEELCKLKTEKELKTPKKKKVKKSPVLEDSKSTETASWQRVTIILELMQHIDVTDEQLLLPALFSILSRCVEMDPSMEVNNDYIMQLLLGEILNICQRGGKDGRTDKKDLLPEDKFNVELIVQCIRVSDNPQTHHHALLLLAAAANLFPEKVLHNVMSIFTFMGTNVMRQDDSYSFQVISKTVDTVIPALIQAGEKQQLPKLNVKGAPAISLDDIVAMVIRVFVDASPHIPEHRRLPVFSHLVSTVGASRFLHVSVLLLLEKYVVHSPEKEEEEDGTVHSPLDLDFCLTLCQEFEPEIQAEGMLKLLQYVTHLPAEKPDVPHRARVTRRTTALFSTRSPLFDVHSHSAKHLRQFTFVTTGFISTVLSSDGFVSQEQDSQASDGIQNIYLSLIEEVLTFVTTTAQHADGHTKGATGKFWHALLHQTYDIIDKVNQLLPPSVFVSVIRRLLGNSNPTVRRKAMELLNTKLGHSKAIEQQIKTEEFLHLVEDLLSLVKKSDGSETPVNRQTALYSLKLLARVLAEQQPNMFTKVLETCIEVFTNKGENSQVSSNALLCLGEVCAGLKANTISYLPRFMPGLLELLQKTGQDRNVLLLLCSLVTLHKVTQTLPHFLSPYLTTILQRITCPSLNTLDNSQEDKKKSNLEVQLQDRLSIMRKDIAQVITPRVLIPAISMCYDNILNTSHLSIPLLMGIVHEAVTCMDKRDVTIHQEQLFKFFLVVLDFRVVQPQCESNILEHIESVVISTICGLVIKMSEATFRPMFLKLVDWATRGNADRDRLLVFYRLCDNLADKLKKLMVLFAGYIIKNCAILLDANNIAKTEEPFYVVKNAQDKTETPDHHKSCVLINSIMDCLQKCLLYSTRGFIDKERFNCLMQPIVDQLENQMGSTSEFQDRIANHVVPCLAQLAVAAGNDAEWKPLNHQVLLKTRHSSPQVRFAALKALEEFHRQLGEEFIVHLLPESLPFLAELMEDECPEVEQQCQHVAQQIETIIGEPLQKYLES